MQNQLFYSSWLKRQHRSIVEEMDNSNGQIQNNIRVYDSIQGISDDETGKKLRNRNEAYIQRQKLQEDVQEERIMQNQCTFCPEYFTVKNNLLTHLKEMHGILQPYQCISCSKRFSSYPSLWRHRKDYCKMLRRESKKVVEYTLSAFLVNVQMENWIPTYGEMLTCCIIAGKVAVVYDGQIVGEIPQPLTSAFGNFLQDGTIHVKIAGALIQSYYGKKLPVDYLFVSRTSVVNKLISAVENT